MQQSPVELEWEKICDIPEMTALTNDRVRRFVFEYAQNGCNGKAAASAAGYDPSYASVLRAREDVTAAMFALAKRLFHGGVFLAFHTALKIMDDPNASPSEQLKAAAFIADRGGMAPALNVHVKHTHEPDEQEWFAKVTEYARRRGLDPAVLLGPNTPGLPPPIELTAETVELEGIDEL